MNIQQNQTKMQYAWNNQKKIGKTKGLRCLSKMPEIAEMYEDDNINITGVSKKKLKTEKNFAWLCLESCVNPFKRNVGVFESRKPEHEMQLNVKEKLRF